MILLWLGAERDGPRRGRGMTSKQALKEVPQFNLERLALLNNTSYVGSIEQLISCHIQDLSETLVDISYFKSKFDSSSSLLVTTLIPFVLSLSVIVNDWENFACDFEMENEKHLCKIKLNGKLKFNFFSNFFSFRFGTLLVEILQLGPAIAQGRIKLPFFGGSIHFVSTVTPIKPFVQKRTHAVWCETDSWIPSMISKLVLLA